jgi:predicted NBD/HSP70 family sugar kinase
MSADSWFAGHLSRSGFSVGGGILAAVMRQIARRELLARSEIAEALRVSPATVSKAATRLIEMGLVQNDLPRTERRGRPLVPLRWSDDYACLGVSVVDHDGRTSLLVGVVTGLDGRPIGTPTQYWSEEAGQRDGERLLDTVASFVKGLGDHAVRSGRTVLGVGVQIGGHVHDGVVRLPYKRDRGARAEQWGSRSSSLDVRGLLEKLTGCRVSVENDVTALAVYENLYGTTSASSYIVVAVFHDGVGAGVVINGKIWRGHAAMAGEVGHIRVRSDRTARECRYGHRGCMEAYSTPASIMNQLGESAETAVSRRMGDRDSATFLAAGEALGYALATIVNWLNPEKIIVYLPSLLESYAWQQGGRRYLQGMRNAMQRSCFSTGAETVVQERYLSAQELQDRCARAAAGLVLESIVEDVETQEGSGRAADRWKVRHAAAPAATRAFSSEPPPIRY